MSLVLSALDSSRGATRPGGSVARSRGAGAKGFGYKLDRPKVSFVLSVPRHGPDTDESLQKDLRFINRLRHPHISRFIASVEKAQPDTYEIYISTHIEGQTLRDLIDCKLADNSSIPEEKVWALLAQLLDAAAACQRLSRPHLNIIPSNIYVSDLFYVKLGRPLLKNEQLEPSARHGEAMSYRSLEFITGTSFTYDDDIWSIGCIAYELCTLVPLFPSHSINDMLTKLQGLSRLEYIPGYSMELLQFIIQLLNINKTTCISAQDALRHPHIRYSVGQFHYDIQTELSELTLDDLPDLTSNNRAIKSQSARAREGTTETNWAELTTISGFSFCENQMAPSANTAKSAIKNLAISHLSMSLQECVKMAENKPPNGPPDPAEQTAIEAFASSINKPRCKTPESSISSLTLAMTPGESALLNSLKVILRPCMHLHTINDHVPLFSLRYCAVCDEKVKVIEFVDEGIEGPLK